MSQRNGKIFLVDGRRTPFGKFGGSLATLTPVELSLHCSQALLQAQGVEPAEIDEVIFGNVIPSTTDTLYAGRHLALRLGCPEKTPGYVLNRLCGSGIQVMWEAAKNIALNRGHCYLVSGAENMSLAPHLTYGARFGTKYGGLKSADMLLDALTDQYCQTPMGITAENLAKKYSVSRAQADEYSVESHRKAAAAWQAGAFDTEVVPVQLKRGAIAQDEHFRQDADVAQMQKLRPSFQSEGTVTAGTASGIVDGACSLVVASEQFVQQKGLKPLAELCDFSVIGVAPTHMGIGPVPAIKELLAANKLQIGDIDLLEINEAFAAQVLACAKALVIDPRKLNIWGGAIALGHPLAASGTRIALTLARQLQQQKQQWGIAAACIGGGQGIACLLRNVNG